VPFVAGERYSIADISAMVAVDFAAKAINFARARGARGSQAVVRSSIETTERHGEPASGDLMTAALLSDDHCRVNVDRFAGVL
jgi:glutathione S-transferase